jgi:uncharacterized protein with NAD-binding domain and iron-sulfur cluster
MAEKRHIGVVGGGMAGLTAALRLAKLGHRVTLWERGERFGGQAAAFDVTGGQLEFFYHHLFQSDREIVALMEELGIGDKLAWLPSNVGYFADGKIYPLNGAADLLKLKIIPFQDRVRLGLVTAYLQRVKSWRKYEKVTAERWLRRALGNRAYERTWGANSTRSSAPSRRMSPWSGSGARSGSGRPRGSRPSTRRSSATSRAASTPSSTAWSEALARRGAVLHTGRGPIQA